MYRQTHSGFHHDIMLHDFDRFREANVRLQNVKNEQLIILRPETQRNDVTLLVCHVFAHADSTSETAGAQTADGTCTAQNRDNCRVDGKLYSGASFLFLIPERSTQTGPMSSTLTSNPNQEPISGPRRSRLLEP